MREQHRAVVLAGLARLGGRAVRLLGDHATEMSSFTKTDAGRAGILGMQALQRVAHPEDTAAAIVFLASDEAQCITGDTLRVDGGSKL